ncbi:MAG: peptidoglycan recognition family protein [bacterium]
MKIKNIRDELPQHPNKKYPKRKISDITHIDIHHSASLTKNYKGISTIESFAKSHINKGWAGLGYHYVIDPNGKVYKTGYANEMRWSVGGNNSYTISIMIIGSFDKEDISDAQYNALLKVAELLKKEYNVDIENIMGHSEYPNQNTACPGIDMDKMRSDLK